MKTARKNCARFLLTLAVFSAFSGFFYAFPREARAVEAGASYIRCDRMKASTDPGDCLVVFTTSSTAATETSIKITLDSEWVSATNFSTTASNYTTTTTGIPAGTSAPSITSNVADNVTGNTIRFPLSSALSNSTTYAFFITGSGLISNPAASTTIIHTIFTRTGSDAATADTKDVAVPTIADDQIVVTATVAPTFTFVFSNNAQNLGTLSTGSVTSGSGTNITITTNAASGWKAWAKSTNAGLLSASAGNATIATAGTVDGAPSSLSAGTEGYVMDVNKTDGSNGGTVTVDAEYDGGDTSSGGTLSTSYQPIATADGPASSDVLAIIPRAAISGLTKAATDYTDTLTIVGAGNF